METTKGKPVLREKGLPFQMYWDALHCLRKMILTMERAPGEVSEEARRARRRGKTFENARAADTEQERERIIEAGLDRCKTDDEREEEREALEEMLGYAEVLDEETAGDDHRVTEKQVQFKYLDPATGWMLPAKPDEVQYDWDPQFGGAVIRVIDEKIAGRMTSKIKENLFFFGLVVSLVKQEEARQAEIAERDEQRKRDAEQKAKGNYHPRGQKRGRGRNYGTRHSSTRFELQYDAGRKHQRPPGIVLVAKLAGKVRDGEGNLVVNAPQPEPMRYSRYREREQLDTIRRVIRKIERAFETGEFPATGSFECNRCPFRNGCDGFEKWQAQRNGGFPVVLNPGAAAAVSLPVIADISKGNDDGPPARVG